MHIQDEEIKDLIQQKNDLVNEGQKISRKKEKYEQKVQDLQNELNQKGHEVQQIKDKVIPLIEERIKPQFELGEFEDVSVKMEDGEVYAEKFDHLEEGIEQLKQNLRNQFEQNESSNNGS